MRKKLSLTVSNKACKKLRRQKAKRAIGDELDKAYTEAAADVQGELEALEWCEALIGETLDDEDFTDWPNYPSS
jgi:hypothetical protein